MAVNNRDPEKLDLKVVHDKFNAALLEEDDVDLELYLESFQELNKFFTLLGTLFAFVSQDLVEKIELLNTRLKDNDTSHKYKTVKTMIEHEKETDLLYKTGFVSGSRTLLRVHRGLEFMEAFLEKISKLKDEDSTHTACSEAYDATLSKYHSFVIRNGAKVAMYTLPTRENLLKKVCGSEQAIERATRILPTTLQACRTVHGRIENLYTLYDLHGLP